MLIEFNVKNFRSICETQTLSLVAGTGKELQNQNTFPSGLTAAPRLLRSGVIYGPNAAGKSNIMRAINFMQKFVLTSQALQEGQSINAAPFLLNSKNRLEPSEFEVTFVQDKVRYQYGFAVNNLRVTHEWLLAFPEGRPQRWFERTFISQENRYGWHFATKTFNGPSHLLDIWKRATRQNGLFLSTAIQLNNEQLKPVFNWFQQKLAILRPGLKINMQSSIDQCASEEGKKRMMEFMNAADLGIHDINLQKQNAKTITVKFDAEKSVSTQSVAESEVTTVNFIHKIHDTQELIPINLPEESDGTQKLFAIAGPWLEVLTKGLILFVDELDTSLHPLMVRFLINLVNNPDVNVNNAQLVFTTHDTSILDTDIYRRDQVWFVEKDSESATKLYPLSDFSPRKKEALENGYLKGRYGALPYIGEFKF